VPAPDAAYQITTGTSIAAAEASGLAALMIERDPKLKHAGVRRILMDTAKDLGPTGHDPDFGAGLVNALGRSSQTTAGPSWRSGGKLRRLVRGCQMFEFLVPLIIFAVWWVDERTVKEVLK
jgi:Subtilase family